MHTSTITLEPQPTPYHSAAMPSTWYHLQTAMAAAADNPHTSCIQKSFNARCAESNAAVNASDGADYAAGTMVWTLFDYYGEPPVGGQEVSSTYGQYDLCGFPKAAASW